MRTIYFLFLGMTFLNTSCKSEVNSEIAVNFYESELFDTVQRAAIFKDSKTFTDLAPNTSYSEVIALYNAEKEKPEFNLEAFVRSNFSDQSMAVLRFETDTTRNMYQHISSIWDKLKRGPDAFNSNSSRIPLPMEYIVPGGRFQEIYYWDSYFTLEGLLVDGEEEMALSMVENFSHLIDSLGFIPNGTRNYYLTRSQPPFYSLMVEAVSRKDSSRLRKYLPFLLKEYNFWMDGKEQLTQELNAVNHVVLLPGDMVLNRFWDRGNSPRPEAYKEDIHLASALTSIEEKQALYKNLRAAACSGWDFSSRWYASKGNFSSTVTTDILPVDLNTLLYYMETLIAKGYKMEGDITNESEFLDKALKRKTAIDTFLWDKDAGMYGDYNFTAKNLTGEITLAGSYPLFFGIASDSQAEGVRNTLVNNFLKPGGLVTTLEHTGQQWDAPNGWAPLQWIAVKGLLNYGYTADARTVIERWLQLNERVYNNTGKMMEKYNVEDLSLSSGGGEYPTQDGFGWTNGVALGFREILSNLDAQTEE